ncbi:GNAT family N-acetyltransferase [Vibrio intestinalis]|uniref:GNAT family N-acetyltransferase n=1 Tax=Vibrio intestinalis TaxID=2933291 RepID=UPI0021A3F36E|nr:GNAT family N-acetyltransferase [Vibrio intestinalis]
MLQDLTLKPLDIHDAKPLLAFELENQTWFERHISAREKDFYSLTGVQIHIANLLLDKHQGLGEPYLLIGGNEEILGRINLTHIDMQSGKAFVGYRIGEHYAGNGVAKRGVSLLLQLANQRKLSRIVAVASVNNVGSQKVLLHHGFKQKQRLTEFTQVQGKSLDCFEYWLDL